MTRDRHAARAASPSTRQRRRRAAARRHPARSRAPSARSANGANATVSIKVTAAGRGLDHEPASVSSAVDGPEPRPTTRRARRRPSTRSPTSSVTKTDSPDPVAGGQALTYTLGVQNAGPSSATGVVLTDTLPGGRDVRVRHSRPRAAARRRPARSPARSGRSRTAPARASEIKVTPQSTGSITNQASVTSSRQRPQLGEQLRERRDDRRTRPRTCR